MPGSIILTEENLRELKKRLKDPKLEQDEEAALCSVLLLKAKAAKKHAPEEARLAGWTYTWST